MSAHDTMTELRELRERAQGAQADQRIIATQLEQALKQVRDLETALQQVTIHRNRLLVEKDLAWGRINAPDAIPTRDGRGDHEC